MKSLLFSLLLITSAIGQTTLNVCTGVNIPVGSVAFNVVTSQGPLACLIFPSAFVPAFSGSTITLNGSGGGGGGGGVGIWGQITGTLSAQTDLQTALNQKQNTLTFSGNTTKVATVTGTFTSGDFLKINSSGNLIDGGFSSFSAIWSSIQNPAAPLSLSMGSNGSTFTYGNATGSSDLFKLTDSTTNSGTGILFHATTTAGSAEIPFQADSNGVGFKLATDGSLTSVGGTTHALSSGTNGNSDLNGSITLSGGAGSYSFTGTYATAPICLTQDVTAGANTFTSVVSTSALTISSGTGSDLISYICMGRN